MRSNDQREWQIAYKAEEADECAKHHEIRGCASTVNAAVVQLEFTFLSGETCRTCAPKTESVGASNGIDDVAGVSRGHSRSALGRRPERKERESPRCDSEPSMMPTGGEDEADTMDEANPHDERLEQILSSENMREAWTRVKANKGAAGVDGLSISKATGFIRRNWEAICSTLARADQPQGAMEQNTLSGLIAGRCLLNHQVRTRMLGGVGRGS